MKVSCLVSSLSLVGLLFAGACDYHTNPTSDCGSVAHDMAMPPVHDLAHPPADLSTNPDLAVITDFTAISVSDNFTVAPGKDYGVGTDITMKAFGEDYHPQQALFMVELDGGMVIQNLKMQDSRGNQFGPIVPVVVSKTWYVFPFDTRFVVPKAGSEHIGPIFSIGSGSPEGSGARLHYQVNAVGQDSGRAVNIPDFVGRTLTIPRTP